MTANPTRPKRGARNAAQKPLGSTEKKTSAYYMRRMREGLTAAGYVKHEAWVLPEHKELLKGIEKALRQPHAGIMETESQMTASEQWTIDRLYQALCATEQVHSGEMDVSLAQGAETSIKVSMNEFGGLPVFIAVVGAQIVVDTLLVDQDSIVDTQRFNDAVLRSREMFPLSSIGIETMPNGEVVYNMFGSLSSESSLTNVVTEINTLVENVQRAADAFSDLIRVAA